MCIDCNKKKDQAYVENLAEKVASATGEPQQVYVHTTYEGEIFDFEPLGIKRENIIKIIKMEEGKYLAISTQ
jgi:hypothetical protein